VHCSAVALLPFLDARQVDHLMGSVNTASRAAPCTALVATFLNTGD
jgi:hypothetical protein